MKLLWTITLTIALSSLVVSGCAGNGADVPSGAEATVSPTTSKQEVPVATPLPSVTAELPTNSEETGNVPGAIVEKAKKELGERLGVPIDQVRVIEARAVLWPDASLGCPQPGMGYAQVVTPGYLVLLESSGEQYSYHMDTGNVVILCQESALPSFPVTPGEIDDGQPWMPVN